MIVPKSIKPVSKELMQEIGFFGILMRMELRGLVRQLPGKMFVR
jgi:hypothetical protein